ncbi:MAG: hypothetical protein WBD47_08870, partial [Phormidesmis sp.]
MAHSSLLWMSGLAALLLALVHLYAGKFKFLSRTPRSRWLSMGSGVSVAYVFVHILPDLSEAQSEFQANSEFLTSVEHHIYVVSLVGMIAFYGLERTAKLSRQESRTSGAGDITQPGVFWLHMG